MDRRVGNARKKIQQIQRRTGETPGKHDRERIIQQELEQYPHGDPKSENAKSYNKSTGGHIATPNLAHIEPKDYNATVEETMLKYNKDKEQEHEEITRGAKCEICGMATIQRGGNTPPKENAQCKKALIWDKAAKIMRTSKDCRQIFLAGNNSGIISIIADMEKHSGN